MCEEWHPVTEHAASLAAAMVRHMLPTAARLRLEITMDEWGTWLHLTYPPTGCGPEDGFTTPGDLALIDSMAARWGHFGDSHWHTLWALLAPSPHTTEAGD